VTRVDALVLVLVAVAALSGMRKGLLGSALSAVGVFAGAVLGARLAPHLLPNGESSPYTPVVGLLGAATGAILLETIGSLVGGTVRRSLRLTPLRALDTVGGLGFGALAGLVLAWVAGAVALHLPGQTVLREAVQDSLVLRQLNHVVPPARLMEAIERVDPFPTIVGPAVPDEPPDPALLERPGVARAAPSVVRVLGSACGLAVTGSGWVAAPELVVTAAHVVAGQRQTTVQLSAAGGERLSAVVYAFDARNDVAVLHVAGLTAPALRIADARPNAPVAILGYPESGPFSSVAGRVGRTATVVTQDAYGRGPVRRTVTSVRGDVRQGNSGGPAVYGDGSVAATVFAARVEGGGGYGIPPGPVREALGSAEGPVSTGACVR
jgi:S1-C subfamily serine protease